MKKTFVFLSFAALTAAPVSRAASAAVTESPRRTRLDFTVGLDYVNIVGDACDYSTGEIYGNAGRINRLGLAFGIAMHF